MRDVPRVMNQQGRLSVEANGRLTLEIMVSADQTAPWWTMAGMASGGLIETRQGMGHLNHGMAMASKD